MQSLSAPRERWMLLTLAGIQFTHILDFMIMMPLGPQFTRAFALTAQQFGFLVSAYTFAASISALCAAMFVDRFERKQTVLTLYGLFAGATLACALAPNYLTLLCARALAGVFGGILGAMVFTVIGDTIPEARRGRAMGLVMSSFALSTVAGVPLGLLIAGHSTWRWTFVFVALIATVVFIAGVRSLPRISSHLAHTRAHPLRALWTALSFPNHLNAFMFMVLLMFAGFTVIPFLSLYLVSSVGIHEVDLAGLYLAGGVATLASARLIGRWSDRYGKLRVFRVVALLSLLPIFCATHAPVMSYWLVMPMFVFFLVLISGRMIPGMALVTASAMPGARGTFMSLNSSVQQLAAGAAALTAGMVVQVAPDGRLLHYSWVGYLAMTCTLLAIFAAARLRTLEPPVPMSDALPAAS